MSDYINDGIEALREVETAWLSEQLSSAIANLGYPVGCGIPPHPDQIKVAATALFDRYSKMIEMAARQSTPQESADRGAAEAKASVATPETDEALRRKYRAQGHRARLNGVKRENCPVDGLIKKWWLEGWNGSYSDLASPSTDDGGRGE